MYLCTHPAGNIYIALVIEPVFLKRLADEIQYNTLNGKSLRRTHEREGVQKCVKMHSEFSLPRAEAYVRAH